MEFANVPREPLELLAQIGTRTIRNSIAFDENKVEVRVPALGKLRAHFEEIPMITSYQGEMIVRVLDKSNPEPVVLERIDSFNAGATGAWD
ncbi:MAG: hypothetical protein P1V35_16845, partial [Planctomycetota bacterium]|nr:hypothetical protein [Planctomycetota bacterium]